MDISEFIASIRHQVIIIVGNYGSGKTEVAVNFTLQLKQHREQVTIIDLDIVNPYFRCREARDLVRSRSINIIIPDEEKVWADLPIILPEIKGTLAHPQGTVVLDVGGDDIGARVLGVFKTVFNHTSHEMWMVINTSRPFTEDVNGCLKIISEIQRASSLSVTGLIANTHLMDYTEPDLIYQGYEVTREVGAALDIPVVFVSAERRIAEQLNPAAFACPIFSIERYLLPPWKK